MFIMNATVSLTHCYSSIDLSLLILRMSIVNPMADPPIIKMMMSERTPPTTEADSVQLAEADSV